MRAVGPDARTLTGRIFFETLVRVHREGEGAAYAGLIPAGTDHAEQLHPDASSAASPAEPPEHSH